LKDKLEAEKKDADAKRKYLNDLKNELSGQKGAMVDQQDEKEYLLKKTKSQEKSYQKMLSELEELQKEIQSEIFELEDKLRFAIDKASIPAPRSGVLEWPAEGILSQGYGLTSKTGFINDSYKFHNGIDIAASYGTPIFAAQDGVVAAAGNSDKYCYKGEYGKWITANHNNGLTKIYAHLSSQSVSAGQAVKKGDLLGYMGSSGFSTGPHLHFTVYATNTFLVKESKSCGLLPFGGSINPMDYL
jgi:murein DD-endopeptidase MepM/ murein hydrolase activator NlpD